MFDFIPIEYYSIIFYSLVLIITFNLFLKLQKSGFQKFGYRSVLFFFIIVFMGLRPISYYFGDMGVYAQQFINYKYGFISDIKRDLIFETFLKWSAEVMSIKFFFLTCAVLYVYPVYLVSKKWFGGYWFYAFVLLAGSFSFWSFGTNGIRNGLATSLFLLGMSRDKRLYQALWILLAIGVHKSLLLPALGFLLAQFYNQPKKMIAFWLLCIPLSLVAGGFWETFFAGLGFDDERVSYLTQGNINDDNFSSTGFRWDFLLYSATAVFAGWYFIVKKQFNDKVYFALFTTYVFANAFWILVIRANFSNRFAYLSWFMMALVIIYPFLKQELIPRQNKVLAQVMLIYVAFTFVMNVVLAK